MKENLIDRLKTKEDEIEVLLEGARRKAAAIKEEAVKKASAIKAEAYREMEEEIRALRVKSRESIENDAAEVDGRARAEAEEIESKASGKTEPAVEAAVRFILKGG